MLDRLDVGAWIGIVALVLSVPVGVVSHMIYHSLQRTLERRKLIKTDQTRLQAIQAYNHVKARAFFPASSIRAFPAMR
jgi:hypothetical protein